MTIERLSCGADTHQKCPFPRGSGHPSNKWFFGSTRISNPNGISIGSAVFAGLTNVTNRQTDRQTTLLRVAAIARRNAVC